MNLVFFDDAIGHILRIARVLRQARGSLMLIGMGGSGKQSLIRISSFMYEMQYRTVEIRKGMNNKMFREDIKELMFESGIHGRKIAFTMTDNQIVSESFLEDLNNMLNTGEIPNLMAIEDKELIFGDEMRKVVIEKKLIDTNDVMAAQFVDRVREYLHICLCMSPVGDALRIRARNFPSLVNCCTLDWFSSWPKEALLYVSTSFLKEIELPNNDIRENLANMCASVHVSVKEESETFWGELRRRIYTTPKSYLDLIGLYTNKLEDKRLEYNTNRDRLAIGLKKLSDTKIDIEEFK
jgi:dynein heavy chain